MKPAKEVQAAEDTLLYARLFPNTLPEAQVNAARALLVARLAAGRAH